MQFLVPNIAADLPISISDKESEEQMEYRFASLKHKQLHLTEGQLLTIAAAARSPTGIQQLIDSGLPALLTALITGIDSIN